jgi:putative sigma-54 modulation protein
MKIIIESPHFTVDKQLQSYTMEKAAKLAQLDERLLKCEVLLKLDYSSTDDNKICEMVVSGDKKRLFASSKNKTFEESVAHVIHELAKQLGERKTAARGTGEKIEINTDHSQQ